MTDATNGRCRRAGEVAELQVWHEVGQIIYVLDLVSVQFHRIEGSNRDRDVLCAFGAFLCRDDDFIERLRIHEID